MRRLHQACLGIPAGRIQLRVSRNATPITHTHRLRSSSSFQQDRMYSLQIAGVLCKFVENQCATQSMESRAQIPKTPSLVS
jgi:hypothetical protein